MGTLVIERASGARPEIGLDQGIEIPPIQPGDKIRLILADGQSVRPQIVGGDVVIALPVPPGAPPEAIILEDFALYLSDDETALSIVDEETGAALKYNDAGDILSDIAPAEGRPQPSPPEDTIQSSALRPADVRDGTDLAGAGAEGILDRPTETLLEQVLGADGARASSALRDKSADTGDFFDITEEFERGPTEDQDQVQDETPDDETTLTVTAQAIDGYIVGATVFRDSDADGVQDADEEFTTTGADGLFTITVGTGPLVLTGGTDVATGLAFQGTLTAPSGSTVVTPLTTLIQTMVVDGIAADASAAEQLVKTAFGLSSDIDLTTFDPVQGVLGSVAGADAVMSTGIKVQDTIVQAAKVLDGAGGSATGFGTVTDAVYSSLAGEIGKTSGAYGIDDLATVQTLIKTSAETPALGLSATAKTHVSLASREAAMTISDGNTLIGGLTTSGSDLLTQLAQTAFVTQNAAAESLYDALNAVRQSGDLTDLTNGLATTTSEYTGGALIAKVNTAEVGDVDGALIGTVGNDTLTGTDSPDVIEGGAGADVLSGAGGKDRLIGGFGDDTLIGGAGDDNLTGGDGSDRFVMAPGDQADTIEDFRAGDQIDLSAYVDAGKTLALSQSGANTLVKDGATTVVTIKDVAPTDLWLASDGTIRANATPVAETGAIAGDEDQVSTGRLVATDANAGDILTFALVDGPSSGTLSIAGDGIYTFDPGTAFQGLGAGESRQLSFTYSVSDGKVTVDKPAVLTVTGANDAPVAVAATATTGEQISVTGQVQASDADANDSLTYALISAPAKGTLTFRPDGIFTFDPGTAFNSLGSGQSETVTFVYAVSDGKGGTDTETVAVTVTGSNAAPVIDTVVSLTTDEDTTLSGTLADTVSDADASDTLTFALVHGTIGGTITIQPDGRYTFDPGSAFQALDSGEPSLQTFTYSVTDSQGVTVQRSASLIVTGANDAPQGVTTALVANENGTVTGTLLGSDIDVEALTFALVSAPAKGTLTINPNGTYSFDPGTAFDSLAASSTETVTFQYSVSDGAATALQTATITVTGANDAPIASPATVTRNAVEDGISTGTLPGSDVDIGAPLTFAIVSQPARGTLTITDAAAGTYAFNPGTAFQGLDDGESVSLSFVYSVSDGSITTQKTATMIVTGANDAPVAVTSAIAGGDEDVAISGQLVATDVDVEASGLAFSLKTPPNLSGVPQGTMVVGSDGTYTFTPDASLQDLNAGQSRVLTFQYTVSDGTVSVDKTATITVAGHDDAPVGVTVDITGNEDTQTSGTLSATDVDTGAAGLTFALVTPPASGTLTVNADGSYSFNPAGAFEALRAGQTQDLAFTYSVSDGTTTVNVDADLAVAGINDAPTGFSLVDASDGTIDVDEIVDPGTVIGKLQSIVDADTGDAHSYSLVNDGGGRFALNTARNEIVVKSGASFDAGSEPTIDIVVRVTDGAGASHDETFTIDVNNVVNGNVADGYISNALVFRDSDNDGVLDAGEASTRSDVEGNFRLVGGTGNIVIVEGTDVSTGLAFDGVLIASEDASVATPLTSVMAKMVANGDAADDAAAESALTAALDITSPSVGLLHFDPVEHSAAGTAGSIGIMGAGVQVQDSADILSSAVVGATNGSITFIEAMNAAFSAMGGEMADGAAFQGLSSDVEIEAILAALVNDTHVAGDSQLNLTADQKSLLNDASSQIADIVAASAAKIDSIIAADGSNATSALTQIAQTAIIAQGETADSIRTTLASGSSDLSTEVGLYTGAALDTAVANAVAGDIDGNNAPVVDPSSLTASTGEDATLNGQLVVTDADAVNLTALTYAAETQPGKGTLSINSATGAYTYTPAASLQALAAGESTTDSFTFTVSDGLASVTETVQLTINGSNDGPVAVTAAIKGDEDTVLSGTLQATDVDNGDSLTFDLVSQPSSGVVTITDAATGAYTFNANGAFEGLDTGETSTVDFIYRVTDSQGSSVQKTVTVTVSGHNDAPVGVTTTVSAAETGTTTGTLQASDVDVEGLTFAIVSRPDEGTLTLTDASTGAYSFDPGDSFGDLGAGDTRELNFTYSVSDGTLTVEKVATLIVSGQNNTPVAVTTAIAAKEDSAISGTLIATDADSDALTFAIGSPPAKGLLTPASNGDYTYDPKGAFESLKAGETEDVTFTYTVTDEQSAATAPKTVTITVTGANDGPVATAAAIASGETGVVTGQLQATDADGDSLTYALETAPAQGTLTVSTNGSFSFNPGNAFTYLGNGDIEKVPFVFSVSDGTVTAKQTGTITVTGVNAAPVPQTTNIGTSEDAGTTTGDLIASDADSGSLSFALESRSFGADQGTLTVDPNGTWRFVPGAALQSLAAGETATLSFTYSVSDGDTKVNQAATVSVTGSNDAPVAAVDTAAATENGAVVSIDVLANDTDIDSTDSPATLRVVDASAASGATVGVTGLAGAGITYDPGTVAAFNALRAGETTTDTISHTIADSQGAQSNSTVTVTVTGRNDGPVLASTIADQTTNEDAAYSYDTSANFSDADSGDPLSYSATLAGGGALPAWLSIDANTGVLSGTPENDVVGTISVTVTAADSAGATAEDTFDLTVANTNDAPIPLSTTLGASENATLSGNLIATDVDVGDSLTFSKVSDPSKGTLTINADGSYTFVPGTAFDPLRSGQSEQVEFRYDVSDGTVAVPELVTLTVTGENDAPVPGTTELKAQEDTADSGQLVATDVDSGDTLTFGLVSGPSLGSMTIDPNGAYRFDPRGAFESLSAGATQDVQFTYSVFDGTETVRQVATITVTGANDAPVAQPETAATTDGTPVSGQLDARDVDGDTLTFARIADTSLGSITIAADGSYTFDPGSDFTFLGENETQDVSFTYSVTDGTVTVNQTGTVTVTGGNDVPVPVTDAITAFEDSAVTGTLVATDGDAQDTLTFSLVTPPSPGSIAIDAGGSYRFDPAGAFESLAVGQSQNVKFVYRVSDGIASADQEVTVTVTGANDAPTVAGAVAAAAGEDSPTFRVDLLQGASDPDATDSLNITNLTQVSGDASGISVSGNSLVVDPSAYNALAVGETSVITYSYDVFDGNGGSVAQTATVTINGANDAPTVAAAVSAAAGEDSSTFRVDLLQGASDPDATDSLNITNLTQTSGDASGIRVSGNSLVVDPSAYNALAVGETSVITYSYDVFDGNGGTVAQTATVTINGANDAPTVAAAVAAAAGEDSPTFSVDLLQGASDPDATDSLSITNLTQTSGDASGISVSGNSLVVDPSAYNALAVGETSVITYSYDVFDGNGGTVAQTATVTINGANDAPTVAAAVAAAAGEDDPTFSVDLLQGASDPDATDSLNITNLTQTSGDASGISVSGNSLVVGPSAYNALAAGETSVITYSYDVFDGNGGTVAQTATVTINGANDTPTAGADSNSVYKGDTVTVTAADGVLVNDTDPDTTDTLTVTAFDATSTLGATVVVNADGSYRYDPSTSTTLADLAEGAFAQETFTYTANDGYGGTSTGTVTITVSGSVTLGDSIRLGEDGILRVDGDGLSVSDLNLSGFTADVEMLSLGTLTRINFNSGQSVEIDATDLDPISEAGGTLTIAGGAAADVVNAGLQTFTDGTPPTVLNLLALEIEGLSAEKSIVPDRLTVDGSHTDAIAAFWIQLDQLYVGAGDFYNLKINTSFAYLGNDYARYLNAGGAPLMDIVKVPAGRAQALHDNLLGNLGDEPIASRFTNLGEPDPRTADGALFGDRPYHAGSIADGVYSNVSALSSVMGWDIAHGIDYPDSLPSFYAVIDGANTVTGSTSDDYLFGGAGNDTLNAGSGDDSIVYTGSQLDYTVSTDATSFAVAVTDTDTADGDDGTDTVTGAETLLFDDGTLRFEAKLAHAVAEVHATDTDGFHPGTGLTDINFLVSDNTDVGVEAALKTHNRYHGDVQTDGTIYHTETGFSPIGTGVAFWNFNYSIVTYKGLPLSDMDIVITADFIDIHGNRTNGIMTFDAVAHENATNEDYYKDDTGATDGLQNSQNIAWYATDYDEAAPGTYELTLSVTDKSGAQITSTTISVDVAPNITVAADGSGDYTTIQDAIAAATDGDTVFVKAGQYDIGSTIVIDKSITLLGAQAGIDPRTAAGLRTEGSSAESIIDGGGTLSTLIRIAADDVTIDGFDIGNGTGDLVESEIAVANPTVRYNFVHDSSGDEGMQIRHAADAVVEYNHVSDTAGDGINLSSESTDGTLRFNEVHNIASDNAAIYIYDATNTTVEGNLIYDVTENDGIKIGAKSGSDSAKSGGQIIDNTVRDTVQDGVSVYMSDVTVSGNDISGSTSENGAVYVSFDVNNVAITNNTLHDNGVSSDDRVTFAIRVGKSTTPTEVSITGNTFTNNDAQIFMKENSVSNEETLVADNTFDDTSSVGVTHLVGTVSGRFSTIQAAVDDASAGDTILVSAGTYAPFRTSIGGPADVRIVGLEGAVIAAANIAAVPSTGRIVDLQADGTVFEGFTITGPGGDVGTPVGISVSGRGVTVQNNTISDVLTGIQTTTEYSAGNNTIADNTVNSDFGISLQNTDNTVTGNNVTAADEGLGVLAGVNTLGGNSFSVDTGGQALGLYLGAVSSTLGTSENTVTVGAGDNLTNAAALAGDDGTLNIGDGDYTSGLDAVVGAENLTITGGAGAIGLDFELDTGVLDLRFSGAADVSVTGNTSNNTLRGGSGADMLDGGDGNDTLYGNDGNDTLDGGNGNDTLIGGNGNDTLTGGDGNDTFVFGKNDTGTDRITDFTAGDVLDFTDVLDGGPTTDLQFSDIGGDTEVRSANDGFATVIAVVESVAAASMSLDSDGNVTISDAV